MTACLSSMFLAYFFLKFQRSEAESQLKMVHTLRLFLEVVLFAIPYLAVSVWGLWIYSGGRLIL
ncbi:hypothetical protein DS909_10005 [Phaeobacter gallaeciensis]|uniref:Uncharacterized protein n=1 Tax=Phaeobacter gallaeciensis TaxID=60890 RepID=A0A366WXQ0_9RHOB|nr:hypothetical protein DS909_10005 [Phaeobacter gallaeciensis]